MSPLSVNIGEDEIDDPDTFQSSAQSITALISPASSTLSQSSSSGATSPPVAHYPKFRKPPAKKQPTLEEVCERVSQFKNNDPRLVKITQLIAEMICLDLQPFSVVEDLGFRRLLTHLEPRFVMLSRKALANTVIPHMYETIRASVMEELALVKFLSITTHMRTSISGSDYMAVTCHFYKESNKEVVLTHKCLEVIPFKEVSHTAFNLKRFFLKY